MSEPAQVDPTIWGNLTALMEELSDEGSPLWRMSLDEVRAIPQLTPIDWSLVNLSVLRDEMVPLVTQFLGAYIEEGTDQEEQEALLARFTLASVIVMGDTDTDTIPMTARSLAALMRELGRSE